MLIGLPSNVAYLRIRKNEVTARNIKTGKEVTLRSPEPFTTTRLLVGEFRIAGRVVGEAMKAVFPNSWWSTAPAVVMHPLEMIEGGLAEIEERLLKELALGIGAAMAVVVTGAELTDEQVRSSVRNAKK